MKFEVSHLHKTNMTVIFLLWHVGLFVKKYTSLPLAPLPQPNTIVLFDRLCLQAYFGMTVDEFRVKVALGSERPHVERRWPKMLQRLLRRCWQTRPVDRPSFDEILGGGVLEEVCAVAEAMIWTNA